MQKLAFEWRTTCATFTQNTGFCVLSETKSCQLLPNHNQEGFMPELIQTSLMYTFCTRTGHMGHRRRLETLNGRHTDTKVPLGHQGRLSTLASLDKTRRVHYNMPVCDKLRWEWVDINPLYVSTWHQIVYIVHLDGMRKASTKNINIWQAGGKEEAGTSLDKFPPFRTHC